MRYLSLGILAIVLLCGVASSGQAYRVSIKSDMLAPVGDTANAPPVANFSEDDSLTIAVVGCHEVDLYNPNSDTIWITSSTITENSGLWWWDPKPTPQAVPPRASVMAGTVCVVVRDTIGITAHIDFAYQYRNQNSTFTNAMFAKARKPSSCLGVIGNDFGEVPKGYKVARAVWIQNNSSREALIKRVYPYSGDTSDFQLVGSYTNADVWAGYSFYLSVHLNVPEISAKPNYSATYAIETYNNVCPLSLVTVTAKTVAPVADTITLAIDTSSKTIAIHQTLSEQPHAIFLKRGMNGVIGADSIRLVDPSGKSYFGLTGMTVLDVTDTLYDKVVGPYLFTVAAGDTLPHSMLLIVYYKEIRPDHSWVYPADTFYIVSKYEPNLAAVRGGELERAADFTLSPNPAASGVTISVAGRATVEIYDLLGRLVVRREDIGELAWSPMEEGGSYIVRVVQRNEDGTITSRSKRLVFVR